MLAANVSAWPASYFLMQRWLRDFAYRTPIHLWIFALSELLALLIALLTIIISPKNPGAPCGSPAKRMFGSRFNVQS